MAEHLGSPVLDECAHRQEVLVCDREQEARTCLPQRRFDDAALFEQFVP